MPPGDPSRQCADCGTSLSEDATFCPSCGSRASRSATLDRCPNCGAELGTNDQYCTECGTPRADENRTGDRSARDTAEEVQDPQEGSPPEPPDREQSNSSVDDPDSSGPAPLYSRAAFRERVGEYTDAGWSILDDRDDEVDLQYRDAGGLLFHAALVLMIIPAFWGNLLYAGYRWLFRAKEGTISAYEPPEGWPDLDPRSEGGALHYVGALVAASFLLLFLAVTIEQPTNPIGWLWSLGALLAAVHLLPPARRRLLDRGPLTEFGRTRSTEEAVDYGAEPCVVCGSVVNTTLRRTYEERVVAAGVPLYTADEGENHYCETCAKPGSVLEDRLDAGDVPDPSDEEQLEGGEDVDSEQPASPTTDTGPVETGDNPTTWEKSQERTDPERDRSDELERTDPERDRSDELERTDPERDSDR